MFETKSRRWLKIAKRYFPVGAVVQLPSGGKEMTVIGYEPHARQLKCIWHDAKGRPQEGFAPASAFISQEYLAGMSEELQEKLEHEI